MRKVLSLLSAVVGAGFTTAAYADIYGAGPAYPGNPTGGTVTCRVFNAGLAGATITLRQIIDNTGAFSVLAADTCNVALAPTRTCFFSAPATGNLAYSCRLFSAGPDENLRGAIEVFVSPAQFVQLPLSK